MVLDRNSHPPVLKASRTLQASRIHGLQTPFDWKTSYTLRDGSISAYGLDLGPGILPYSVFPLGSKALDGTWVWYVGYHGGDLDDLIAKDLPDVETGKRIAESHARDLLEKMVLQLASLPSLLLLTR